MRAGALGVAGATGAAALRPGRGVRFSGLGVLGGLVAGLGGLVLAQQYGVVYPSPGVALGALGGGLVLGGTAFPSLFSGLRG